MSKQNAVFLLKTYTINKSYVFSCIIWKFFFFIWQKLISLILWSALNEIIGYKNTQGKAEKLCIVLPLYIHYTIFIGFNSLAKNRIFGLPLLNDSDYSKPTFCQIQITFNICNCIYLKRFVDFSLHRLKLHKHLLSNVISFDDFQNNVMQEHKTERYTQKNGKHFFPPPKTILFLVHDKKKLHMVFHLLVNSSNIKIGVQHI